MPRSSGRTPIPKKGIRGNVGTGRTIVGKPWLWEERAIPTPPPKNEQEKAPTGWRQFDTKAASEKMEKKVFPPHRDPETY